ncbi:MAG: Ezrin/radixin/moesin family protein [Bacteroidota bacterium]
MFTIGNKKSFFLLLAFSFFAFGMNAQELSKEEVKKWKDLAKEYKKNPAALKILTEKSEGLEAELNELNAEVGQLQQESSSFQAQMSRKNAQINDLQTQINRLNMDLSEAQASLASAETSKGSSEVMTDGYIAGVVFKVQIGAFERGQLSSDLMTSENLNLENTEDYQKVVVGQFRDYESAKILRDQLKKMGVKGAWIVSYRDGERITVKEALGGE